MMNDNRRERKVVVSILNDCGVGRRLLVQRSIVSGDRIAFRLTTGDESIAGGSIWARADSKMGFSLTVCAAAAIAVAWIDAGVVDAGSVVGTFSISLTFASNARRERVAGVAWRASADGAFPLSSVESGCANGVGSAWIGSA